MKKYYLEKNVKENGNYEVHCSACGHLPSPENQINLGFHDNANDAITQAKKIYPEASDQIQGCIHCTNIY